MTAPPPRGALENAAERLLGALDDTPASWVRFSVWGTPRPKGSHRGFVVKGRAIMAPASKGERAWRDDVTNMATMAMQGAPPLEGPVSIVLEFFSLRPKGHFRRSGEVKPGMFVRPPVKPDASKLMRSVEDALTGVCYRDDAQIVEAVLRKRYTSPAQPYTGVRISVGPFEGEP